MESIRDTRLISETSVASDVQTSGKITPEHLSLSALGPTVLDEPSTLYKHTARPFTISEMSRGLDFLTTEYQEGRMSLAQFNEYLRML